MAARFSMTRSRICSLVACTLSNSACIRSPERPSPREPVTSWMEVPMASSLAMASSNPAG
jgi:hypothetical protein